MTDNNEILDAAILIVDDQEMNIQLLERLLQLSGFTRVTSTMDPRRVFALHREHRYDLILLDLYMPGMDGFSVMEALKGIEDDYLPIMVITGQSEQKLRALEAGAKDFIDKPFDLLEVRTRIRNMLEVRLMHKSLQRNNAELEQRVDERTTTLRASEARVRRLGRLYAVLGGINRAIVRIHDRDELFREACRVAVRQGSFSLAWVSLVDPQTLDEKIVAALGGDPAVLAAMELRQRDNAWPCVRPAGIAARGKEPVFCNDLLAESNAAHNPEQKLKLERLGYRSLAALPVLVGQEVAAVIMLVAREVGTFDSEEIKLLSELASDLSFGLQFIEKEERLSYLALYDVLTGLPNRRLLLDRLSQLLHGPGSEQGVVAVIVINLQHFADLNQTIGRHAGDAVLREVAERLEAVLSEPRTLARIGGDSFAIAIPELRHGVDAAGVLAQQILAALTHIVAHDGQDFHVTVQAGLALFPDDGEDAETLLKHAELALKKARSSGEIFLFYAPEMNKAVSLRLQLESDLRVALAEGQFLVHYQPRVDLLNGRIASAEALIRWRHPQRGLLLPHEFIYLAEMTGLIVPIGAWLIDAVCAQQAAWQRERIAIVPVAVNLSAVQFKKGPLVATIRDAIAAHGLAQKYLEFELTESVVMDDPSEALDKLRELKRLGIKLSLDDFGTGYSSLAYLKTFPFDFVKIDRSFVTDITRSPPDAAIATAVISLARSLSLRVIAEGVETEGQLRYLRQLQCDEMQGNYFSTPLPADEFAATLLAGKQIEFTADSPEKVSTVLIVDDEPHILTALASLLQGDGYRLLTASSGAEGLEVLALNSVQVILSDQCMPDMTGAVFLSKVKALYPDIIRIILSGDIDFTAIADSVNRGVVFRFLSKPWEDRMLRENVRDAFHRYRPGADK